MGEVYRARDTKLKRDVAIKILPEEFSRDLDRISRFQREAEVLASLNHPNIAAIYNVEEANNTRFLVLELVEGEMLAERIQRGPIPAKEALHIAKSICEALEAAHEKGIVHRDLKPANVKITPEGKVKVLDFGLAKAMERYPANASISNSPTLSALATNAGVILGTAAYMSPEQAKGFDADRRSDIFSFGCILFEMLTGRQPFQGDTVADVLASVLAREPDLTKLPANLNPRLLELLHRCLEKDPRKRWHAAADTRVEIEAILADPRGLVIPPQPTFIQKPLWKRAIPVLAGLLVAAALAALATWYLKPSPAGMVTRFPFTLPEGQQFTGTGRQLVAISPDGTQFVYVANNRLYLKPMRELNSIAIQGTEVHQDVFHPVFSPDGRYVAFYSVADRAFKKIPISGGAAVTLFQADSVFGVSWGPDDQIVFGLVDRIVRVFANGGKPETIVTLKAAESAHGPQILPDGKTLLFSVTSATGNDRWESGKIVAQSLKTGERKILIDPGTDGRYVKTGHLVYELNGNLLAVPFDLRRLQVTGGPVPIVEGVRTTPGLTGEAQFSFADNGSLIYIPGTGAAAVTPNSIAFVDRNGNAKTLPIPPGPYDSPRVSPNGKQLTYHSSDGKEEILWVYELSGATAPRRLTFGGANRYPMWSGDGERIIFTSSREGDFGLFWQRADGVGTAERLTKVEGVAFDAPNSWVPKTQLFSFIRTKPNETGLWTYSVTDKKPTPFFSLQSSSLSESSFSPDGQWLAYQSNESKSYEVYVQPFPATGAKFQITRSGSHHPLWSPNGKELYYVYNQQLFSVSLQTQSGFAFSTPMALPVKGFIQPAGHRQFDITPDGKQFVVIFPPGQAQASNEPRQAPQIQVVLNWFTELQQRVPVK
jgi:serine/threonine-protein kinase